MWVEMHMKSVLAHEQATVSKAERSLVKRSMPDHDSSVERKKPDPRSKVKVNKFEVD